MDGKTEYAEKLSAQLVEWDRQLDDLKYKADNATAEVKTGYNREIESLQQQRHEIELRLQKISASSDVTWQEMKDGTDDSWDEVRTDLHDTIVNVK